MSPRHNFQPFDGLRVTLLTKRGAMTWTRHVYNVPPDVGIGWTPYTVLVLDGATSYKAFHGVRELKRWLGDGFTVKLTRSSSRKPWAVAYGIVQKRS